MNSLPVGQSVDEALRLVQTFEFTECLFWSSLGEVLMWCGSLPVVPPTCCDLASLGPMGPHRPDPLSRSITCFRPLPTAKPVPVAWPRVRTH